MALHGVVSTLGDPVDRTIASRGWWADLAGLAPRLPLRVPIVADARNRIDYQLYKQAIYTARQAGHAIAAVVGEEFNRPWIEGNPGRVMYPNEALYYMGNPRHNRWILDTCRRVAEMVAELRPDAVFLGNEWNVLGEIALGANIPPATTGGKGPAMHPAAALSFAYEAGHYAREGDHQVARYLGSMSWIAGSGADDRNPYCGKFLRDGLGYLRKTGATDFPFEAAAINAEGVWAADGPRGSLAAAAEIRAAVAAVYPRVQAIPIVLGEWGWPNGDAVDPRAAAATFDAWDRVAQVCYFFQDHVRVPNDPRSEGLRGYRSIGPASPAGYGSIDPDGTRCAWWGIYAGLIART